jgi:hypothetical protein
MGLIDLCSYLLRKWFAKRAGFGKCIGFNYKVGGTTRANEIRTKHERNTNKIRMLLSVFVISLAHL